MKNPVHFQKRNDIALNTSHHTNSWHGPDALKLLSGGLCQSSVNIRKEPAVLSKRRFYP